MASCGLFDQLPAELRIMIYEYCAINITTPFHAEEAASPTSPARIITVRDRRQGDTIALIAANRTIKHEYEDVIMSRGAYSINIDARIVNGTDATSPVPRPPQEAISVHMTLRIAEYNCGPRATMSKLLLFDMVEGWVAKMKDGPKFLRVDCIASDSPSRQILLSMMNRIRIACHGSKTLEEFLISVESHGLRGGQITFASRLNETSEERERNEEELALRMMASRPMYESED